MIISLEDKLKERQNIEELKECLYCFKDTKPILDSLSSHTEDLICLIKAVTENKGEINPLDSLLIIEAMNRFTESSKEFLNVLNKLKVINTNK